MEEAIQFLANHYDYSVNDPLVENAYKFVKENEKNVNPQEIVNILNRQYRPTSLKIGTVGAFLWGSNQNYYGAVNKACSAFTNNSLLRNINENCQYQIWNYNKTLELLENNSNSKAYVYVNSDWQGFQNLDIDILKNSGVEYVSVIKTENSKHEILIPMTAIQNLPIIKEYIEERVIIEEKSNLYFYLILLIIFIAIVIYLKRDTFTFIKK